MGDESHLPPSADLASVVEAGSYPRDRLLAAIALITGIGLMLALPFALQAGAVFFLPVTTAIVVAIALVPLLEWLERRRIPSPIAALICVISFLVIANIGIASIVVPAADWLALLPDRISLIRQNLGPVIEIYSTLERFINDTVAAIARTSATHTAKVTVESPNSLLDLVATSAPAAIVQMFFAVLLIYFFLSGWTKMRRRTITNRHSFSSAMKTARVIQEMVDSTSAYLATITMVNMTMGLLLAVALYFVGMPSPLMWGGIVAIANYVPYLGPIAATLLLGIGGLMTFTDPTMALVPALIFVAIHLVEANIVTPSIVGRRLTISPLLILLSLSYWGWVWGTTGALLAVPILIILRTVIDAAGKPDIAGFLFEEGTLTHDPTTETTIKNTDVV